MIIFSYLLYYLVILPVSYLPFPLLYLFSDFLYLIFYSVFGYRKKVVYRNLRNSFPEKTEKEIDVIAKKFYHHFCDIVLETIKSFTISEKEMRKRMIFNNPELIEDLYNNGKSVVILTGHFNNWEWASMSLSLHVKHKGLGIYLPLTNKFFNSKVLSSRCSFGMVMYGVRETKSYFEKYKGVLSITGFVADQAPSNVEKCHWMHFLNQDTPVFLGAERYATLYNYPVVFGKITKVKRGMYAVDAVMISEKPTEEKPSAITERHTRFLEKQIIEKPEYWLWTHKRWKHKRQA